MTQEDREYLSAIGIEFDEAPPPPLEPAPKMPRITLGGIFWWVGFTGFCWWALWEGIRNWK